MFDLRDLEAFLAVVERRSFGRAADVLGTTHHALSRRIAAMEGTLGAELLRRGHREVGATPLGELLVREGRAVLARASLADRAMCAAARGATGHLRVGTRSMSRYRLIPEAARLLRLAHPLADVVVADPPAGMELDLLRRGALDIAVARGPLRLDDDLWAERLRGDPIVLALPHDHPFAAMDAVNVADLALERFAESASHPCHGYHDVARGVAVRAGFVPRVEQTFDTLESLAMCVAAGGGIAFMHDASREVEIPGIVYRPLRPDGPTVDLLAVRRADDRNPMLAPFIACLAVAAAYAVGPGGA